MKPTSTLPRPDWSPTHSDLWQLDCCAVVLPTDRSTPPRYAASFHRAARRERRVRRARRLRLLGVLSALLLTTACAGLIAAAGWGALQFSESQAAAVCFLLTAATLLAGLIQCTRSTGPDN